MPLHCDTPLIQSHALSELTGRSVWLKLDALQPCGSFKIRGIGNACEIHHSRGARSFVCSSGGNAGLAVAYAGRQLKVPVRVVVPESATERAKELLYLENADVIVHGPTWQEANEFAQSLVGPDDVFLHPFDDPLLWDGYATLIDEIRHSGIQPDAIVLSVGGGGLLSGIVEGLHRHSWHEIPVFAVETVGANSFHEAMKAGQPISLDKVSTIATSLAAKQVCQQAVNWSKTHPIHSVLVSDHSALNACRRFLDDHRILVEPACGASLSMIYEKSTELEKFSKILVIVCGGATATIDQILKWSELAT